MYVKRLQLANYGPIRDLDINFPFDGERPKPVVLVGENGSGKTISLSHIVNAVVQAKDAAYQESSEVDAGKVFKLRSGSYVSIGTEYYYARTDFESGLYARELRLRKPKHEYTEPPMGVDGRGFDAWNDTFDSDGIDHFDTNFVEPSQTNILESSLTSAAKQLISERCLLYFPSNRAEEPAWLNRSNLRAKPQYSEGARLKGETPRRLIASSPLRDIHDWLYDVAYDRAAFEMRSQSLAIPGSSSGNDAQRNTVVSVIRGYQGDATNAYSLALTVLRTMIPGLAAKTELRFGIGERHNRRVTLHSSEGILVPNLFQLSSGEMALLALFLSVLRDFDLRDARNVPFATAEDIKGLVVVDEVDLHLHSGHQYDVLPKLVRMFPNVQFVLTTHSPLFILGMAKEFGEDGFHVYDLPTGSRVTPEDFDEFGQAFVAFKQTSEFSDEIRAQVRRTQRPILFVEGTTDRDYLRCAAKLLGKENILDDFEIQAAGGDGRLKVIWKSLTSVPETATRAAVLLNDPEKEVNNEDKGAIRKRKMPFFEHHPISKGVENLFDKSTLENARNHHAEFIDIEPNYTKVVRGEDVCVEESWTVNDDEKRNLCDWLCEQAEEKDFCHFQAILEILEELVCEFEHDSRLN